MNHFTHPMSLFIRTTTRNLGLSAIFVCFLLNTSCRNQSENFPPARVLRYDKALMEADTSNLSQELKRLAPEYWLYLEGADLDDTINILRIRNFIADPLVKIAYEKAQQTYANPEKPEDYIEYRLGNLFGRINKLFPSFQAPTVFTYNSYFDFANRIIYLDSILSIAIDLYTYDNEKFMDEVGVPRYISRRMNSTHLETDVAKVLLAPIVGPRPGSSLLDYIITDGKILYLSKMVLPDIQDNLLLGYTEEELKWSEKNESMVWNFILQQNLLFETNPNQFRHFVNEGPFNSQIQGAPARLNQYIGLKIVEKYVRKSNADTETLLHTSPIDILRISQYKP